MSELKTWFKKAGGEYQQRKKAAEKQVVRWEYATKDDRSVEPLYFDRNKFGPGKKLPKLPSPVKYGNMEYGLDESDRTVVERMYVVPGAFYERFLAWSDGALEWVYYNPDHVPENLCRATVENGRITGYVSHGSGGAWVKSFEYRDDGSVRVVEKYTNPNGRPGGKSDEVIVPKKKGKEPRVEDLLPALEKKLIAEIPSRVKALKLKERAFTVIVAFGGKGNDMFPPTLGVGLERERQLLTERNATEELWNPADYDQYDTDLDGKPFAELNRAIARSDGYAKGYKAYARIAAALRKLDWRKILSITDDFVLIAVDYDDTGLMKQLREVAGAKTFAEWKKKKWVR